MIRRSRAATFVVRSQSHCLPPVQDAGMPTPENLSVCTPAKPIVLQTQLPSALWGDSDPTRPCRWMRLCSAIAFLRAMRIGSCAARKWCHPPDSRFACLAVLDRPAISDHSDLHRSDPRSPASPAGATGEPAVRWMTPSSSPCGEPIRIGGGRRLPNRAASIDRDVCRCESPHSGALGSCVLHRANRPCRCKPAGQILWRRHARILRGGKAV